MNCRIEFARICVRDQNRYTMKAQIMLPQVSSFLLPLSLSAYTFECKRVWMSVCLHCLQCHAMINVPKNHLNIKSSHQIETEIHRTAHLTQTLSNRDIKYDLSVNFPLNSRATMSAYKKYMFVYIRARQEFTPIRTTN